MGDDDVPCRYSHRAADRAALDFDFLFDVHPFSDIALDEPQGLVIDAEDTFAPRGSEAWRYTFEVARNL